MIRLLMLLAALAHGQPSTSVHRCFEDKVSLAYFMQYDTQGLGDKPVFHGVYRLVGVKVLQKVDNGYLLVADPEQGYQPGLPIFLEIKLPIPPGSLMQRDDFAEVVGNYDYVGLDGFTHRVPRVKWYKKSVESMDSCS